MKYKDSKAKKAPITHIAWTTIVKIFLITIHHEN